MSPLDQLRALVEHAPKGTLVPVESLAAILQDAEWTPVAYEQASESAGDLTVKDIANELGRSPSTIRGWLADDQLHGAYKLRGRDWRVPQAALRDFLDGQRGDSKPTPAMDRLLSADLGTWRKEYADAA